MLASAKARRIDVSQSVMVVSKLSAGVRSTLRPAGCVRLDEWVIAVI